MLYDNVIKQIDYDAFGNVISDSNPEFSIPFGFAGGDTNLYGYVLSDPINLVDPNCEAAWAVAGAIVGESLVV